MKILNIEEKYNNDIKEIENKMNLQLKEYQIKINEMKNQSEEKIKMEKERWNRKKIKLKKEKLENEKIKIDNVKSEIVRNKNKNSKNNFQQSEKLENKPTKIIKKISKLKIIILELKRNVDLDIFLNKNLVDHYNNSNTKINIFIRVENYEEGKIYYWTPEIFQNRYDLMKELYNKFIDENFNINSLSKEEDPLSVISKQIL